MFRSIRFLLPVLLVFAGCSDSDGPTKPRTDRTSPGPVTDLAVGTVTTTSIAVSWTAPGDDGASGTASAYDLRYATTQISDTTWAAASQAVGVSAPHAAGSDETFTVSGLLPGTTYYFCVKASDEVPNWSGMSNMVSGTTQNLPDTTPPRAVHDLEAGSATTSSLTLTWTAVGDDDTLGTAGVYDIRYATAEATPWDQMTPASGEPVPAPAGAAQNLVVVDLSPTTTYYFAMKVADEVANWSGVSNVAYAATLELPDITPPETVEDLEAGSPTTGTLTLTWTAPGDDGVVGTASAYEIRYALISGAAWEEMLPLPGEPAPSAPGEAESFQVQGLSPATTYYFRLRTADEVPNWSLPSNLAQAATSPLPDTTPPDPVQDLAAVSGTATTVTLTWTAVGDDGATGTAAAYNIRYATSEAAAWEQMTETAGEPAPAPAGAAQHFAVTGLASGTTYYFRMKTADEVPNWSDVSNTASATTLPPPDTTPPASVQTLAATSPTTGGLTLVWTAVGDDGTTGTASAYDIRTAMAPGTPWEEMAQAAGEPDPAPAGQTESFVLEGLSPGTVYYVRMKVADEVRNWSAVSNEAVGATSVIPDTTPPSAIADLSAGSATATALTLTWTAAGDDAMEGTAAAYDIRSATAPGTSWEEMTPIDGEPAPAPAGQPEVFVVTGLLPSTTYYFALKASDEVPNWSDKSNQASGTTEAPDVTPPGQVMTLAAGSATSTSLTLTWTAVGDDGILGTASAYDVRYSTLVSTSWENMTQVTGEPAPGPPGLGESFVVTGLNPSTVYYFRLAVGDEAPNWSAPSNQALGSTSFGGTDLP